MKLLSPFLASCLAFAAATQAEVIDTTHPPIRLQQRLMPGQTYETKMTTRTASSFPTGEQVIDQNQTMIMHFDQEVSAIEGSPNLAVKFTYTRMAMKLDMMGQEMDFDSDEPDQLAGNPMAAMAQIVGKSLNFEMSPDLEILKVEGEGALLEAMGPAAAGAKDMFDKDQLQSMMNNELGATFPEEPIPAGHSWDIKLSRPMPGAGTLEIKGKATLKGMVTRGQQKLAVIEMKATGAAAVEAEAQAGLEIQDLKMNSLSYFDVEKGFGAENQVTLTMNLSMQAPGQDEAMEIPSNSEITTSTSLK